MSSKCVGDPTGEDAELSCAAPNNGVLAATMQRIKKLVTANSAKWHWRRGRSFFNLIPSLGPSLLSTLPFWIVPSAELPKYARGSVAAPHCRQGDFGGKAPSAFAPTHQP